jgi:hypothetical protein
VRVEDSPLGAGWSAERPPGAEDDGPSRDYSVSGPVIRVRWDYGVGVPLWDADGLLPEEPQWLREALRLGDPLIQDLKRWCLDMEKLHATRSPRTRKAYEALGARGEELARRVRQEVGARYTVQYVGW